MDKWGEIVKGTGSEIFNKISLQFVLNIIAAQQILPSHVGLKEETLLPHIVFENPGMA
jgi:hypothetical protein